MSKFKIIWDSLSWIPSQVLISSQDISRSSCRVISMQDVFGSLSHWSWQNWFRLDAEKNGIWNLFRELIYSYCTHLNSMFHLTPVAGNCQAGEKQALGGKERYWSRESTVECLLTYGRNVCLEPHATPERRQRFSYPQDISRQCCFRSRDVCLLPVFLRVVIHFKLNNPFLFGFARCWGPMDPIIYGYVWLAAMFQ